MARRRWYGEARSAPTLRGVTFDAVSRHVDDSQIMLTKAPSLASADLLAALANVGLRLLERTLHRTRNDKARSSNLAD